MKLKKTLAIILTFIMCFGLLNIAFADESAEIPEGYTPIYTAEDLNNIRNNLSDKYILMNDIDLSVYENWEPIGTSSAPFAGELDGNGYLIKNLKIKAVCTETYNFFGLFGVTVDSTLKNIIVLNGNISVSENESADMTNSHIAVGMIAAKTIGENYSKILRSSATGKIDVFGFSYAFIGGLVGIGIKDNCILSSSNYADINVNTKNEKQKIYVGGLLGSASENEEEYTESFYSIEQSANLGNILINNEICSEETQFFVGGISGLQTNGNEMSNCYNRGEISSVESVGKFKAGGILGRAISRLEKSYNSGKINIPTDENDAVSSICFINEPEGPSLGIEPLMPQDFVAYNCYCLDSELSPCLQNPDDYFIFFKKIYSLSESEFTQQESFESFDFEKTWEMEENGYPVLRNQPEITVKESIELEVSETYSIKPGKDYIITSESPLSIDYISPITESGEFTALEEGKIKLTVIYDYGYTAEYDITITEPISVDPIIPTPDPEPTNNVESAEIVYVPLKNRIVFSTGSPNLPDGIVLKLTYKDGTEKTETIIRKDNDYRAGEENVFGAVHTDEVRYGLQKESLYINDESIKVEYDYFVIPPIHIIIIDAINNIISLFIK